MSKSKQAISTSGVQLSLYQSGSFMQLVFNDAITLDILNNSYIQLIQHPDFKFNMNACYDFVSAFPDLEMPEIEEHAHFVARNLHLRGSNYKLAMVASDTLNYALLSVYKLLISKSSVDAEVFSKRTQAIEWLLSGDD